MSTNKKTDFTSLLKLIKTITSGNARSSSHQLKVLYFLLNRDLAKRLVTSSGPKPLPVVDADHTIKPGVCEIVPFNPKISLHIVIEFQL